MSSEGFKGVPMTSCTQCSGGGRSLTRFSLIMFPAVCAHPPTHPPHTHTNPVRPPPLGQFYLEVRGLRPGRYHYKYIVDNTWAVDPFAPKDLDAVGE